MERISERDSRATMLREQLERAREAFEKEAATLPEKRRQVLRERARALAATSLARSDEKCRFDIIEFSIARENFGVSLRFVREVAPVRDYSPVPGAPPFVLGITSIRGRMVSLVDLGRFFELPSSGLTDRNKAIVIFSGAMEFALLADTIVGVRSLAEDETRPPPKTMNALAARFLKGVTPDSLAILDAEHILHDRALFPHEPSPGTYTEGMRHQEEV